MNCPHGLRPSSLVRAAPAVYGRAGLWLCALGAVLPVDESKPRLRLHPGAGGSVQRPGAGADPSPAVPGPGRQLPRDAGSGGAVPSSSSSPAISNGRSSGWSSRANAAITAAVQQVQATAPGGSRLQLVDVMPRFGGYQGHTLSCGDNRPGGIPPINSLRVSGTGAERTDWNKALVDAGAHRWSQPVNNDLFDVYSASFHPTHEGQYEMYLALAPTLPAASTNQHHGPAARHLLRGRRAALVLVRPQCLRVSEAPGQRPRLLAGPGNPARGETGCGHRAAEPDPVMPAASGSGC